MSEKRRSLKAPTEADQKDDSNVSEVFVLPPELLQKLGINLGSIQHVPEHEESKEVAEHSKQKGRKNHKDRAKRSKKIIEQSPMASMSKGDTSILETANLMKSSVPLSPTFQPAITNATVSNAEIDYTTLSQEEIRGAFEHICENLETISGHESGSYELAAGLSSKIVETDKTISDKSLGSMSTNSRRNSRRIKKVTSNDQFENIAEPKASPKPMIMSPGVISEITNSTMSNAEIEFASESIIRECITERKTNEEIIDFNVTLSLESPDLRKIIQEYLPQSDNIVMSQGNEHNTAQKDIIPDSNLDIGGIILDRHIAPVCDENVSTKESGVDVREESNIKSPYDDHLDEAYMSDCSNSNLGNSATTEIFLGKSELSVKKLNMLSEEISKSVQIHEMMCESPLCPRAENLVPVSTNSVASLNQEMYMPKQCSFGQVKGQDDDCFTAVTQDTFNTTENVSSLLTLQDLGITPNTPVSMDIDTISEAEMMNITLDSTKRVEEELTTPVPIIDGLEMLYEASNLIADSKFVIEFIDELEVEASDSVEEIRKLHHPIDKSSINERDIEVHGFEFGGQSNIGTAEQLMTSDSTIKTTGFVSDVSMKHDTEPYKMGSIVVVEDILNPCVRDNEPTKFQDIIPSGTNDNLEIQVSLKESAEKEYFKLQKDTTISSSDVVLSTIVMSDNIEIQESIEEFPEKKYPNRQRNATVTPSDVVVSTSATNGDDKIENLASVEESSVKDNSNRRRKDTTLSSSDVVVSNCKDTDHKVMQCFEDCTKIFPCDNVNSQKSSTDVIFRTVETSCSDKVNEIASYLEKCAHLIAKRQEFVKSTQVHESRTKKKIWKSSNTMSNGNECIQKPGGSKRMSCDGRTHRTYKRSSKSRRPLILYCEIKSNKLEAKDLTTLCPKIDDDTKIENRYCICGDFGHFNYYDDVIDLYQHDHFLKIRRICCRPEDSFSGFDYIEYIENRIKNHELKTIEETPHECHDYICWEKHEMTQQDSEQRFEKSHNAIETCMHTIAANYTETTTRATYEPRIEDNLLLNETPDLTEIVVKVVETSQDRGQNEHEITEEPNILNSIDDKVIPPACNNTSRDVNKPVPNDNTDLHHQKNSSRPSLQIQKSIEKETRSSRKTTTKILSRTSTDTRNNCSAATDNEDDSTVKTPTRAMLQNRKRSSAENNSIADESAKDDNTKGTEVVSPGRKKSRGGSREDPNPGVKKIIDLNELGSNMSVTSSEINRHSVNIVVVSKAVQKRVTRNSQGSAQSSPELKRQTRRKSEGILTKTKEDPNGCGLIVSDQTNKNRRKSVGVLQKTNLAIRETRSKFERSCNRGSKGATLRQLNKYATSEADKVDVILLNSIDQMDKTAEVPENTSTKCQKTNCLDDSVTIPEEDSSSNRYRRKYIRVSKTQNVNTTKNAAENKTKIDLEPRIEPSCNRGSKGATLSQFNKDATSETNKADVIISNSTDQMDKIAEVPENISTKCQKTSNCLDDSVTIPEEDSSSNRYRRKYIGVSNKLNVDTTKNAAENKSKIDLEPTINASETPNKSKTNRPIKYTDNVKNLHENASPSQHARSSDSNNLEKLTISTKTFDTKSKSKAAEEKRRHSKKTEQNALESMTENTNKNDQKETSRSLDEPPTNTANKNKSKGKGREFDAELNTSESNTKNNNINDNNTTKTSEILKPNENKRKSEGKIRKKSLSIDNIDGYVSYSEAECTPDRTHEGTTNNIIESIIPLTPDTVDNVVAGTGNPEVCVTRSKKRNDIITKPEKAKRGRPRKSIKNIAIKNEDILNVDRKVKPEESTTNPESSKRGRKSIKKFTITDSDNSDTEAAEAVTSDLDDSVTVTAKDNLKNMNKTVSTKRSRIRKHKKQVFISESDNSDTEFLEPMASFTDDSIATTEAVDTSQNLSEAERNKYIEIKNGADKADNIASDKMDKSEEWLKPAKGKRGRPKNKLAEFSDTDKMEVEDTMTSHLEDSVGTNKSLLLERIIKPQKGKRGRPRKNASNDDSDKVEIQVFSECNVTGTPNKTATRAKKPKNNRNASSTSNQHDGSNFEKPVVGISSETSDTVFSDVCGVCNVVVTVEDWFPHIQTKHEYIAWRVGEEPINTKNEKEFALRMNTISKKIGGLVCPKCGIVRKKAKEFFKHLDRCDGVMREPCYISVSTLNSSQTNAEPIEVVLGSNSNVTCGVCSKKISSEEWYSHATDVHYDIAWPVGAREIDLKSTHAVERVLKQYKMSHKQFVCNVCMISRVSAIGFYAHVLTCGKTEEEIEKFQEVCTVCNQKYICIYKQQHYAVHQQAENRARKRLEQQEYEKEMKKKRMEEEISEPEPTSGRRRAAQKARTVIEDYNNVLKQFRYRCGTCDFGTDSQKEYSEHSCEDPDLKEADVESEDEAESDESEDSVDSGVSEQEEQEHTKRKKMQKEVAVRPRMELPFKINNVKDYLYQGYKNFCQKHYTTEELFPNWNSIQLEQVPENEIAQYLPPIEESCKLKAGDGWTTIKRFEAKHVYKASGLFVGGTPHCVSWAPPRDMSCDKVSTEDNYLAVATHRGSDPPRVNWDETVQHNGFISIWNFGSFDCAPELALGLCHSYGTVWSLSWCPSGARAALARPLSARLGLLAVAASNGVVYILPVPYPSDAMKKENMFYKIKHVAELRLSMIDNSRSCQSTSVSWSRQKGHAIVTVGYSDGTVALYDLTCDSPLGRAERGGVSIVHPYHDERLHKTCITGVATFPSLQSGSDVGAVVAACPTNSELVARGAAPAARAVAGVGAGQLEFAPLWPSVMMAADDLTSQSELEWFGGIRRLGPFRACAGCARCGQAACVLPPLVRLVAPHPATADQAKTNFVAIEMVPLSAKKFARKMSELATMLEPLTYDEAVAKYGLTLRYLKQREQIGNRPMDRLVPDRFPLAEVTSLAFCPDPRHHRRLAVATHSGLIFLLNAQRRRE